MPGIVFIVIIVLLVMWIISVANSFKRTLTLVDQAKADIEIYMVKRYDVIQNSLKTVKAFVKHEDEIFTKLIEIRKGMDVVELSRQGNIQNQAGAGLLALAEAYPELKSQELFMQLQKQLSDENEHYAAAKRAYNANVSVYNQSVVVFPNSIIAEMFGYTKLPFFADENAEYKKEADVEF